MHLLAKMGVDLTPLPAHLQHLITRTSCQHRIELFPREGELPALHYYDGRAMYLGCCQGLGIAGGRYRHEVGFPMDIEGSERGRANVVFSPPRDWRHVGLLAVQGEGGGWGWPIEGLWETWADLCEIRFARQHGWEVRVIEKVVWPEARPLDVWADRLSRLYLQAKAQQKEALAGCYRAIALHTIGRFHNLGYRDRRVVVDADDERVTFDNVERIGPEGVQIKERVPVEKPPEQCHPEWSSAVWSKVRLRICKHLMALPRECLVGVRGDAIFMTRDPGWEDSGKCGVLRRKASKEGPFPAPVSWAAVSAIVGAK